MFKKKKATTVKPTVPTPAVFGLDAGVNQDSQLDDVLSEAKKVLEDTKPKERSGCSCW